MNKFTLSIQTSNAAFDGVPEIELGRILREAATKVEAGERSYKLRDFNGNRVGQFEWVHPVKCTS